MLQRREITRPALFCFFLRLGNEHAQQARVNCLERTRVPVCASSGYPIMAQSTCSPHRAALCVPEPACRNQRMLEGRGKEEQDEKAVRRKLHCQHRLFIRKNLFHSSGETLDGTAKGRSSSNKKLAAFERGEEAHGRRGDDQRRLLLLYAIISYNVQTLTTKSKRWMLFFFSNRCWNAGRWMWLKWYVFMLLNCREWMNDWPAQQYATLITAQAPPPTWCATHSKTHLPNKH